MWELQGKQRGIKKPTGFNSHCVGDMENDDVDMVGEDSTKVELDDMKKRLKEMEDEAADLREMQAKVEKEMGSGQGDSANAAPTLINKEEVDSRSVFVGNVKDCAWYVNVIANPKDAFGGA
ncbi:hypothetical protein Lal_00015872 [Lupinus albus]|uniref:Uncharacterized protein n=1 Tax=Lupinus albus TaxID=3870 RepID=A0A6A5MLN5_LUPAL|nr:hypothetical protein Lalb_Chr05g0217581 [Lupinus albus]KAF1872783.1 hypothetical protein Lal_00015872 [Lupinus albus]